MQINFYNTEDESLFHENKTANCHNTLLFILQQRRVICKIVIFADGLGESCKALLIQLGTMKDLKEAYLVGFEWTKSSQPYSVECKSCNGCSSYQEAQWQGDLPQGFSQEGFLGACQVLIV